MTSTLRVEGREKPTGPRIYRFRESGKGADHATRRQKCLHRQAKAAGRTYRGRLRKTRIEQKRIGTPRVGYGQRPHGRRQEERFRPQEKESRRVSKDAIRQSVAQDEQ